MRYLWRISALLVVLGGMQGGQSFAFDTVVSDSSCRREGFSRPLRQTIVIVDEAAIEPLQAGKASEANRRVNRTILTLAGVLEGQSAVVSAPRERLTVLFALEDGSDLIRAFTGCPPLYSEEEISRMEKDTSGVSGEFWKFLGRDVRSQIENEKVAFQTSILQTMAELAKMRVPKSGSQKQSTEDVGFLQALSRSPGTVDLAEGMPRLVIISPMDLIVSRTFSDVKSAREKGFDLSAKIGADFQRAEVYLTGVSRGSSKYTHDFAHALFLGMKARLAGFTGEALPALAEAPSSIRVYGGFIEYASAKMPMQLRLAVDRTGSLVNSWVEVSVMRPVATPLTGKAVCKNEANDQCEVKGDGKEFSQSWVVDIRPNPTFDEKLPFGGVRYFELSTSATGVKGKVYDPNVSINKKKELPFELSLTPGVRF